jgi:type III secretion protein J
MIFKKSGITSTPFEEKVRYTYGLSQEIEKTLNGIDGVVIARVHLVLPDHPEFGKAIIPSSASVFIKYKPGTDIEFLTPQIRRLVANAIEGLNYSSVNVATIEAQSASQSFRTVDGTSTTAGDRAFTLSSIASDWRNLLIIGLAVLLLAFGSVMGFIMFRSGRKKGSASPVAVAEEKS